MASKPTRRTALSRRSIERLEDLEAAFDQHTLATVARSIIAPTAVRFINERAQNADFLGGSRAGQGYSDNPIKAWKLGRMTKKGGKWGMQSNRMNTTVYPSTSELKWFRNSDGRSEALLLGGYKKYRELAGRQTSQVDLTFTGAMLRSLTHFINLNRFGVEIEITVGAAQQDKAFYTNQQRQWLALSDREGRRMGNYITDWIDSKAEGRR